MKILLASASPRRQELIKLISEDVRVRPADCDETLPADITGGEQAVRYLSALKGAAVKEYAEKDEVVISADTVVCLGDAILGKPHGETEAFDMLKMLSGKTHTVYTGVTLFYNSETLTFSIGTDVTFFELSDKEIKEYIATGEPFDKAGGYGIQGKGTFLVEKISGDYFNVVGLPVSALKKALDNFVK